MSEDVLHEKVQRLVESFREQLRGVLEECSSSARRAPLVHRPRSDGSFTTDNFDFRPKRKHLPRDVISQLHQLFGAVGVLLNTLNRHTAVNPRSEGESMEDLLRPGVVVCGPPGTEPKPGFSRTRLDSNESLVYSRSSTALASKPSPFQKYVIPSKDIQKEMCQVDIYVPEEQLATISRCTRSRTNMFRTPKWKESFSSSESESSIELASGTESEEEETVRRKDERIRHSGRSKGRPKPAPLKLQQRSEPSSVANSDSDDTVLEHPLDVSTPVVRAAERVSGKDNPILKSILNGNHKSTLKTAVLSPAISEEYETAREDLSGAVDNLDGEDDQFYSFCDEPPPTRNSTSPGRRPHPLRSSKKAQRRNGEVSVSGGRSVMDSDDSMEKSGIFNVLREITGYSEQSMRVGSGEKEASSFDRAKSSKFAKKQTGVHAHYVRSISITSILQHQSVVILTKVPSTQRQLERIRQKMLIELNPDSGQVSPTSEVKLSATNRGDSGGDKNSKDVAVTMEMDSGDVIDSLSDGDDENNGENVPVTMEIDNDDVINSLSDGDIHSDDHEESSRSKEVPETPKSTRTFTRHSLSLSLSKKRTPENKFTTPKLHNLSKTVPRMSSAKHKLQLPRRVHVAGNMNSSQVLSSDSDFDNTSLLQQKRLTPALVNQVKRIEKKGSTPTTTTSPMPKRKKILSSFSSDEEEIIPPFLQKQKAEKAAARAKEREEKSPLFNGDVFDDGEVENEEEETIRNSEQSSDLKSTKKLGKYEKSPGGKGKEKAKNRGSTLPNKISCASCSKNLYWKTKKIHSHPRLSVLVCLKCHGKFNQGTFKIEEENEIYCTLCGDGGNIICCSFCQYSFCQDCIKRLSGQKHLDYLLSSDDVDFKCYACDPKDIEHLQKLCEEVCYYFRALSQRKKPKEYKSDKYVLDSDSTTRSRGNSTEGHEDSNGEGGGGGGMTGFSGGWSLGSENSQGGEKEGESSKRRGRSGKKGHHQQQEGSSSDKSSASRGGEGETKNSSKSQRQEDSRKGKAKGWHGVDKGSSRSKRGGRSGTAHTGNNSSSDSMSDAGESSEVNTDDISISDSSLFEDVTGVRKKDKKKASERDRRRRGGDKGEESEGSGLDEVKSKEAEKTVKKKKRRIIVGRLLNESDIDSSDSGDEDQPMPPKERSKKRKHSSSESISKPSRKRGRLGNTLSSGSEGSDNDREKLAITVSDSEVGGAKEGYDSSNELFGNKMSEDEGTQTIKYCTPVKLNTHRRLSDSSDSDVVPLRRANKKEVSRKVLGCNSSAEEEGEAVAGETVTKKKGRVYKTRSKKRKKGSDSEAGSSEDFMSDDLSLRGPRLNNKHKRLRLASFLSSDSSSGEEDSGKKKKGKGKDKKKEEPTTPNTPGQKRKNIRKLIADEKLEKSTREAQREEEERLERLKQKAKLLAPIEDSERVILEQDTTSKKVKVEVRDTLVRSLKPHQRQGIKFLYDSCIENLEMFKGGQTNGAILAHCMGLGKTLQVIAFVDALLNCEGSGVKNVLVLSPVNALHNWINEFHHWIPLMECDYGIYILTETDTLSRLKKLRSWYRNGGVILIGYEMYRNLAVAKKIRKKAHREELAKYLLDPGPDVVVCDEGHVMRNSKSNLSIVLGRIKTRTRIVLTGTPLQNNLLEYYTMVNFVKPNLLGTQKEFTNRFANPIKNGQCRDSNPLDIRKMKQRAHVLHMLLKGSVQRRDYRVLAEHLPPKQEYVLNIRMSPIQDQLYRRYLEQTRGVFLPSDLFSTYHSLSKVWNHPWVLKLDEDRQLERAERAAMYGLSDSEEEGLDDDDTLGGFIVDSDESSNASSIKTRTKIGKGKKKRGSGSSCSSSVTSSRSATPSVRQAPTCIVISDDDSADSSKTKKKDPEFIPEQLVKRENAAGDGVAIIGESSGLIPKPPPREKTPPPWYDDLLSGESIDKIDLSGKLLFLVELLKEAEKLKEKVLVFSQSLLTLDLIEEFLGKEENGDWTPALDYYRLDGSTKAQMRMSHMTEFNKLRNSRLRLFLISTRAGSLGVNLVGANRVVIFDACWNPSHDLQAIFRTYRYGQTKPIFVYRLLAQGTMEEKIYDRQVTKQSLSMRVVDEKQIGRHFTASDLAELFAYSPAPPPEPSAKPIKKPEEDMVLSSILEHMHPQWVVTYHEHDSLLEHVFDEELSEEERKAAWESYNAQKQAETARYNVEALHTKLLREEELQRAAMAQNTSTATASQFAAQVAATQQAILNMQRQKLPSAEQQQHNESTMMVQNVVMSIDRTLWKINELRNLQSSKETIKAQSVGNSSVKIEHEIRRHDIKIQDGYSHLSKNIQFANDCIVRFNHSPAALNPHLLQVVSVKRQQLNSQLEALKNSQVKSMGGAAPPTGSSRGGSSVGGERNHVPQRGSSSTMVGEVSSSTQTIQNHSQKNPIPATSRSGANSQVKDRLIARVAGNNEEKRMRETAKELLIEKAKAPADSSTNLKKK